ncbi:MAG TPA: hypothetical protein VGR71_07310 [Nitrospira sp.]|nr:hypothetical protein [Nitrospira sp.]
MGVRPAALSLAVVLLMAGGVSATRAATAGQVDNLIVPGVRVGKWTLTMTVDELLKMNGPATPILFHAGMEEALSARRDSWTYGWQSPALGAETFDKKKVEDLIAGVRGGVVPYKTNRNVALLSGSRDDVLKAYGKPTVILKAASAGLSDFVYDHIGIAFRLENTGAIHTIEVFRPGKARDLWKF